MTAGKGESTMDISEAAAIPQNTPGATEAHTSAKPSVDKYADARIAKKKQKRKAHRARLRRSNTKG